MIFLLNSLLVFNKYRRYVFLISFSLHTSDVKYLTEALQFYSAINSRNYFSQPNDSSDLEYVIINTIIKNFLFYLI